MSVESARARLAEANASLHDLAVKTTDGFERIRRRNIAVRNLDAYAPADLAAALDVIEAAMAFYSDYPATEHPYRIPAEQLFDALDAFEALP